VAGLWRGQSNQLIARRDVVNHRRSYGDIGEQSLPSFACIFVDGIQVNRRTTSFMSNNSFNAMSIFWLLVGALTGVGATLTLSKLWRHSQERLGNKHALIYATTGVVALTIVAVLLYSSLGRPDLIDGNATPAAHVDSALNTGAPQSMEAVTAQLAARLARDGGSDSDWQLLAESYEFMGRAADAARAREHVATTTNTPSTPSPADTALIATANTARLKRNYDEARVAYEAAIKANAMTADSWADYADVLASGKQGSTKLAGAPAQAIDRALALNPNHTKALWLKASLAHEEHRYGDALATWQHLRSVIGDNESDARIIDANIAEAQQLAGNAAPASNLKSVAASGTIAGTIEIDPKLLARAKPGTTIFIFAKSDSPGPPLAVFRTTVGKWPISFKLDDSMAMMPNRTLSSATDVIVEARISQSGQAAAATGDLQAPGARVKVGDGKAVRLRIDKVVS
jgi:cytochrome c-type biogenesis protein CcmH